MTPAERLKEIEENRNVIGLDNLFWDDQRWLIARVRELEEASSKVISAALGANMSMTENKVVSMELSDLRKLRHLGETISKLSKAHAGESE